MKRLFKKLTHLFGAIAILVFIVFLYGFIDFRLNEPNIKDKISSANRLYTAPRKMLNEIATTAEGDRISSYVAQMLLIDFRKDQGGMISWHAKYALWTVLLKIRFDKNEIFALWCHFAPYEEGNGLNESAIFHYGKSIDELNCYEIASIVARAKSPLYYSKHPIKLENRINTILSECSCCPAVYSEPDAGGEVSLLP